MIEEGQEYTTPLYDEDGQLIEVIEDYDVFLDEEIPEEEHDDAYYAGEEGDLAEEQAEEENVDPVESRIFAASERYTTARDSVIERLTQILENGEITAEDNADLNEAMFEYTESVTDMKDKLNEVEHGNNDTNGINQGTVTTVLPEELQHLIDLMNNGGRNDLLFVDEEGRVLVEGEQVPKLKLVELEVEKLVADYAEINELVAKKATIEDLNAVKAQIGTLEAGEIIADIIHANKTDIKDLTADVGKIQTLVGGNLTMENIQSLILSAKKVTVEDAFIKNAMIDTISAGKINTGSLNTNLVNIQSEDGSLILNGTLQQFKDKNNKVRIQMGKDAQGNFTFGLFDETGTGTLIDSNGIKEKAIGDGLIVDKMIGDNANISGSKLDINSVVTEVNNGTTTIKGSKVKLDEKNQTLDVAFNSMDTTVTSQGKTIGNHTTSISTMQGDIKTLISDTTIIEDGQKVTVKDSYSAMNQTVDSFGKSLKSVESNFNNMEIGGRNLLLDSGKEYINNAYNVCSYKPSELLVEGETYTVSVCVTPANKVTNFALFFSSGSSRVAELPVNGTSKQIVSKTFTMKYNPSYVPPNVDNAYARANLYRFPNDNTVTTNSTVHWIKISKGNKATTDWTPAPEDGTNALSGLSTRVGEAETKLTLDGLQTIIGSAYTSSEEFNNLASGGANIVSNSAPETDAGWSPNRGWSITLVDEPNAPKGKCICGTVGTDLSFGGGMFKHCINGNRDVKVGETYTLSGYIKASKNCKVRTVNESMANRGGQLTDVTTEWTKFKVTDTITASSSKANVFYVYGPSIEAGMKIYVHSVKLCSGTDSVWSDSPDDLQNWVANKGYATTSDVTQAVDNFTLKYKESGGYNELYNGNFKNGFTNWSNNGGNTIYEPSSCPANTTTVRLVGEIGVTKQIYQAITDINYIGDITLSYWANTSSTGSAGTTNPLLSSQLMIEYTDGSKVYPLLSHHSKYDTWDRRTLIYPSNGKRIKSVYLGIYNRDTTKVVYISDVIVSKSRIEVPFAPNPNEVYDGVTTISKDGIKVTQSNYNGYTNMRADGFYLNNGTDDVIRCNSKGLYVKGQIHVESGSISESALAGTLIDGQYIKTDTILARSIKIGDFTNYCTKPSNFTMSGNYTGQPAYLVGARANQGMDASEHLTQLVGGEVFNISGKVYAQPENTSQTNFNVYFYWVGDSGILNSALVAQACAPSTTTNLNLKLTVPERPSGAKFGYFRITCGNANFNLFWINPTIRLMMSGSLIVDGAIDGKTIRGSEIIGGLIRSEAVNEENNPMFSLNADGEIVGAKIDCINLYAEEDISGNVLNINYIGNSRYPQILDEDINVTINTASASDTDFFDGAVYASLDDLYDAVPRNLNGYTLTIDFATDYTGNLAFTKFHSGHVYINFNKKQIRGYVWLYGESMRYNVYGNNRDTTGTATNCANIKPSKGRTHSGYAYSVIVDYCHVNLYDLNIYPGVDTTTTPSGIVVTNQSTAYLSNMRAFGNPQHLVRSHACSQVYVANSDGLTNSNTFSAVSGSVQCLNNTTQAGTNSTTIKETYTTNNAQIFATGVTFANASNSGNNDTGGSTTETINVTLKANNGDTFRRTVYKTWKNDGVVRQGDYGYGDCDGFWFFGSQISKYAGKNITKVSITIKRNAGAGSTGGVDHTLVGHKYTSRPSGTPEAMGSAIRTFSLSAGSSVTLNLTAAEIATFKNYKGIGLKSAYDSKHYSACSATCTIKITYTE